MDYDHLNKVMKLIDSSHQELQIISTCMHLSPEFGLTTRKIEEDVNLNAINTIKNSFNINVRFWDHTVGIEASIAAVAIGAKIIEKHITLDKNMSGPHHKASIETDEVYYLVNSIRNIEKALGNSIKIPSESEKENIKVARKSIFASKLIQKEEVYTNKNLTIKRPGTGLPPTVYDLILGTNSRRKYEPNELIEFD